MQLKKYKVNNIKEAMDRIKEELGEDAFILSNKTIREGGREWLEIMAAVERESASPPFRASAETLQWGTQRLEGKVAPPQETLSRWEKNLTPPSGDIEPLREEIASMKAMLKENQTRENDRISLDGLFYNLYKELCSREIHPELALRLVKMVEYQSPLKEHGDPSSLHARLAKVLLSALPEVKPLSPSLTPVLALVGPTGVGKTTTVAKLAAFFSLAEEKRVSLISVDTYRIGAAEQLKTYASLIGLPFALAQNRQELEKYMDLFRTSDLILIDTAGRSPRSEELGEEKALFQGLPLEVILLLSSSQKTADLLFTVQAFRHFSLSSLLFTKLDETVSYGNLFNVLVQSKLPLSYFGTGQRVPEDLEIASPGKLVDLLFSRGEK